MYIKFSVSATLESAGASSSGKRSSSSSRSFSFCSAAAEEEVVLPALILSSSRPSSSDSSSPLPSSSGSSSSLNSSASVNLPSPNAAADTRGTAAGIERVPKTPAICCWNSGRRGTNSDGAGNDARGTIAAVAAKFESARDEDALPPAAPMRWRWR